MKNRIIEIEISKKFKVAPEMVFESEVVKSGNGAVVHAYKKFIGKRAIVIIKEKQEGKQ